MSLLTEEMEDYIVMSAEDVSDGYGGFTTEWSETNTIKGIIIFRKNVQYNMAQALESTAMYRFYTRKNVMLKYHDVLKRVRDGKTFRITSDGDDKRTPHSAYLDLRCVTCEEWEMV